MVSRVVQPPSGAESNGTWVRRGIVVAYLFLLVAWPVALVVVKTFEGGLTNLQAALTDPAVVFGLQMTVYVSAWAVVINTVFGIGISLLLVRYDFPGRRVLSALIDLPLSVSPVVVGLALLLAYGGSQGWDPLESTCRHASLSIL